MISIIYNHHRSNCLLSICISLSLSRIISFIKICTNLAIVVEYHEKE